MSIEPLAFIDDKTAELFAKNLSDTVIKQFKESLKSSKVSQVEAAQALGMSQPRLSKILSGNTNMTLITAGKLLALTKAAKARALPEQKTLQNQ